MEQAVVSEVGIDSSESLIRVQMVPDRPGIAARIFKPIGQCGIVVNLVVQNAGVSGLTDLSFTVPAADFSQALELTRGALREDRSALVSGTEDVATLSVIGAGFMHDPNIAAATFEAMAEMGINLSIISTSTIRIACVIPVGDSSRVRDGVRRALAQYLIE